MTPQNPEVHRYRRTDQDRLGEWAPVDSAWKTTAGSGLVAHDIYHHLPGDTGTFADEVAALGAEWYVDIQRPGVSFEAWPLSGFERNASDSALNALDSNEPAPFDLPLREAAALTEPELTYLQALANRLSTMLRDSPDPRAHSQPQFVERFVQNVLWGYVQAKIRFPDQRAVRTASRALVDELASLETADVPFEHEVTISRHGYDCVVTYEDADAALVREKELMSAVMMTWCSCEHGYPLQHATVHSDERAYREYVEEHFARQERLALAEELQLIPEGDSSLLRPVYVQGADAQSKLKAGQTLTLPTTALPMYDRSPRGVLVL